LKRILIIILLLSFVTIRIYSKNDSTHQLSNDKVVTEKNLENNEYNKLLYESLKNENNLRYEALNDKINLYIWVLTVAITATGFLLTFFGRKYLKEWIKNVIENKTDVTIKSYLTETYLDNIITQKGNEAIQHLISNLENEGLKKISDIEKVKEEYQNSFNALKDTININDLSIPLSKKSSKNLNKFASSLIRVKKQNDYTFWDWYYKGLEEYNKHNNYKAIEYWLNAEIMEPKDFMIINNLGILYTRIFEYQKAIEYYDRALEIEPNRYEPYVGKGNAYHNNKQYDKALEVYNKAETIDPKYYGVYFNRGLTYIELESFDKALLDFNKSVSLNSSYYHSFLNKGNIFFKQKNYEIAIEEYSKAIKLNPEVELLYNSRINCYIRLERYHDVINDLKELIKIDSTNYNYLTQLGFYHYKINELSDAIEYYKKSLHFRPSLIDARLNLIELYIVTDDVSEAKCNVNELKKYKKDPSQLVVNFFFELILAILNDEDCNNIQSEINNLSQLKNVISWDFNNILQWLNKSNLTNKNIINSYINRFQA